MFLVSAIGEGPALFAAQSEGLTVSRAPHTFRQSDLTRAIKAAVKAGVRVTGAIVDRDGRISVIICNGDSEVEQRSELDCWLDKRGRSHADAT